MHTLNSVDPDNQTPDETFARKGASPIGGNVDLRDYLLVLRRRWKEITASVLAGMGVAALFTAMMIPVYSSSARLFVSTAQSDSTQAYQGGLFSAQRVSSYADLVNSREVARGVIRELGLEMEPAELSSRITATVLPNTVILEVAVTDSSPGRAQLLARAVSRQITALVSELETPPGKSRAPIKATVVDAASLPMSPISPRPQRNVAVGAFLGLLVGLAVAVTRELLDSTVKGPEDVAEVAGVAVVGNIAYDPSAAKRPLVTALDPHASRVEAFRVLRTNMQFIDVDADSRVFTVTSSVPDEGKTTTATNLAITLAQAGQRVLLLEADLRRPRAAQGLGVEGAVGLTTVLVGRVALRDAVQKSGVQNLWVLASGTLPPNPAELLQSQNMVDLLAEVRGAYDVVIVDSPPLLPVTDAALLAARSDGALLVTRHSKTTKDQLHQAMERLDAVGARALGVVLNMVPHHRGTGFKYDYSYGSEPALGDVVPSRGDQGSRDKQPSRDRVHGQA